MNFIKLLKEQNQDDYIKRMKQIGIYDEESFIRMNQRIEAGNYKMSIQCSYGHHCEPQITTKYENYKRMEFAIMDEVGFVDIEVLKGFKRFNELENYFDGQVYSYVPIDLIDDVYLFLKEGE